MVERQKQVLLESAEVKAAQRKLDATKKVVAAQQEQLEKQLGARFEAERSVLMQNEHVAKGAALAQRKLEAGKQLLAQKQADL